MLRTLLFLCLPLLYAPLQGSFLKEENSLKLNSFNVLKAKEERIAYLNAKRNYIKKKFTQSVFDLIHSEGSPWGISSLHRRKIQKYMYKYIDGQQAIETSIMQDAFDKLTSSYLFFTHKNTQIIVEKMIESPYNVPLTRDHLYRFLMFLNVEPAITHIEEVQSLLKSLFCYSQRPEIDTSLCDPLLHNFRESLAPSLFLHASSFFSQNCIHSFFTQLIQRGDVFQNIDRTTLLCYILLKRRECLSCEQITLFSNRFIREQTNNPLMVDISLYILRSFPSLLQDDTLTYSFFSYLKNDINNMDDSRKLISILIKKRGSRLLYLSVRSILHSLHSFWNSPWFI